MKYLKYSLIAAFLLPLCLMAEPIRDSEYYKTHTIIARGDSQFAPFEFNNEAGKPDGFSTELFATLMKRLDLKYDLKLEDWGDAQEQLQKDSIDVLIGMIYSEERAKIYKFGIPHFMVTYDIVSRNDANYESIDQLKGKEIIVQYKDRAYEYLLSTGLTEQLLVVPDIATGLKMLSSGKGDAVILYGMTSYYFIRKLGLKNLHVHDAGLKPQSYSIVTNSKNEQLLYMLNAGLYQMKIDGSYDEIYNKWFGIYDKRKSNYIIWGSVILIVILIAIFLGISALLNRRVKLATEKLSMKQKESEKLLADLSIENEKRKQIEIELVKAKEKAESSGSMKSAFLANMSHEIRTPLNVIVGFSELLETTDDPKEKPEYIQIIKQNSDMLLRLINDILDISKIEAGKMELKYVTFDFSRVFDDAYVSLHQRCTREEVAFNKVNPYKNCIISFDKNRLLQILTNFVTNAIKYTSEGHITMGYQADKTGVKIYVEDTGIGLTPEKQKIVFDRFEKLDNVAQGTGLGLSITKAIVDLVHGKIGVESVEGKGSTFWAWFPCETEITKANNNILDKNMISEESSPQTSDVRKPEGCKILVAEDIDSNYLLVRAILRSCSLSRAINGKEAVEFAQNNKYDVILMDIKMPIMDGLEATRKIREFDKDTPIIALTANAFDSDKVDALAAGCDAYIAKPIKKAELEKTIKESYMKHNQDK
jgi:signal transduction histidine kinase/CheY-like chemotaxis protein